MNILWTFLITTNLFLGGLNLTLFPTIQDKEYISNIYQKTNLKLNTLDENGSPISFVFLETSLKQGKYSVEITDGPGDLYQIKGTETFIKFQLFHGYAGWGEQGILVVGTGFYSTYFVKTD